MGARRAPQSVQVRCMIWAPLRQCGEDTLSCAPTVTAPPCPHSVLSSVSPAPYKLDSACDPLPGRVLLGVWTVPVLLQPYEGGHRSGVQPWRVGTGTGAQLWKAGTGRGSGPCLASPLLSGHRPPDFSPQVEVGWG